MLSSLHVTPAHATPADSCHGMCAHDAVAYCYAALLQLYQKADEEAAKVYEEFVESFAGDDGGGRDGGVKAFVRGGVVAPGSRSHDATGAWCWHWSILQLLLGFGPALGLRLAVAIATTCISSYKDCRANIVQGPVRVLAALGRGVVP